MNPKFAAGIGAVVGMFLSPAAWVALLALTAGRAAINAANGLTTNPLPPELGGDVPAQPAPGMPSWLTTLLLVSVVGSNAQVGSRSSPGRISARVITGYGPAPWPRVARQSAHISTVNSPRPC